MHKGKSRAQFIEQTVDLAVPGQPGQMSPSKQISRGEVSRDDSSSREQEGINSTGSRGLVGTVRHVSKHISRRISSELMIAVSTLSERVSTRLSTTIRSSARGSSSANTPESDMSLVEESRSRHGLQRRRSSLNMFRSRDQREAASQDRMNKLRDIARL